VLAQRRRAFDTLSVSALDLFATALGVFVLMAVILFPYYLKEPSVIAALEGAEARLAAARAEWDGAEAEVARNATELAAAEAARDEAERRHEDAEAEEAAARAAARAAAAQASEAQQQKESIAQELAELGITDLDLVFVMDMTGSMRDETADIRASLLGIIRTIQGLSPSLHMGFVAFKDFGDEYLTKTFQLHDMTGEHAAALQSFTESLVPDGGGDDPEPVGVALDVAIAMSWREGVRGRIVVIGDSPPREPEWNASFHAAEAFARGGEVEGQRRVGSVFTGGASQGQDYFELLASSGDGEFVAHRGRMFESVMLSVLNAGDD
jgi:hypothetical protein